MSKDGNKDAIISKIKNNGTAPFYTRGISMLPMLKEGRDISILAPITEEPKNSDVVLFLRPHKDDELVLHRVIKRRGDVLIIRGDNTYHDEFVKRENVLAVLKGFFRKGKYFDCETSKAYHIYSFLRVFFYPVRRFFRHTLRVAGANIKNNVFHLNSIHLDDIFKKNKSE